MNPDTDTSENVIRSFCTHSKRIRYWAEIKTLFPPTGFTLSYSCITRSVSFDHCRSPGVQGQLWPLHARAEQIQHRHCTFRASPAPARLPVALHEGRAVRLRRVRWVVCSALAAVASTQISAYITHKGQTVRKIMQVMRTAYAINGTWSQHVSNKTWRKRSGNIRASFAKNMLFRWIV